MRTAHLHRMAIEASGTSIHLPSYLFIDTRIMLHGVLFYYAEINGAQSVI